MAMTNNRKRCFTCSRENNTYTCEGCSKRFCSIHIPEHQQILNEELHHIINGYNQFKQRIDEQKQYSYNYSLIEQIDQWERNSIEIIQEKAQELNGNKNSITAADGNLAGQELNQFDCPTGIFIDKNKNIFIVDCANHRVVEWKYNAKEGQIIAGGNGKANRMNQLNYPQEVIVDDFGRIYVADNGNSRIMRWCEGKEEGEIVVGGNNEGYRSNQLYSPHDLSFDDEGNLYVVDSLRARILKFEIM
ncbi:unnamed protein product [Adineta steineri]|uniref:Uncharacterized protein n=1 Tax=Adineta steineri TaxID=433720 RepID=A0A814R5M7_9BILA|nr:unnamed protein product [Adineta steineri]